METPDPCYIQKHNFYKHVPVSSSVLAAEMVLYLLSMSINKPGTPPLLCLKLCQNESNIWFCYLSYIVISPNL